MKKGKKTVKDKGVGVYDKAVKLLSVRLHTTGELHRKLRTRSFRDAEILPVLRRLEELRFLDDERFAQIFVDNLKRYKDFGFFGIKTKLLSRQIPTEIAENALEEFLTMEDEKKIAERLLKKLKRQGRSTYEQLARSFQSRGFRGEVTQKILNSNLEFRNKS